MKRQSTRGKALKSNRYPLRRLKNRGWKALLAVCLGWFALAPAQAGYVWTENGTGAYSGTGAPWVSNGDYTGKWVISGTENSFTSDVNVTGGENLTIDNATVTVPSTQVFRVEQGSKESVLTIQNGGVLNLANVISVSDSSGVSTGTVNLNNGSLISASDVRIGFHSMGTLNINNGGKLEASNLLFSADGRKGMGYGTIGSLNDVNDTGTITVEKSISMGLSGESIVTLNRGTISASNLILGGTSVPAVDGTEEIAAVLNVNEAGTVALTGDLLLANQVTKRSKLNIDGGTVTAKRIFVGDAAGQGTISLTNGGSLTATERIVVGQNGTGTINVENSDLLIASRNDDNTLTYKSIYLGGSDLTEETTGAGTLNLKPGATATIGSLQVGVKGTGIVNVDGGTFSVNGSVSVGVNSGSVGTVAMSGGSLSVNGGVSVGVETGALGTFNISDGSATLNNNLNIGSKGTGTVAMSGGTLSVNGGVSVGVETGALGTFNISDGSATLNNLNIGSKGTGTVAMSGGTLSVNGGVSVGVETGALGTFNISDGSATLNNNLNIGSKGTGTVAMSGGTLSVGGGVSVGVETGASGTFEVGSAASSNRALATVTGFMNIGYKGNGVVEVANGTLTVNKDLNIGAVNSTTTNPITGLMDIGSGGLVEAKSIIRLSQTTTGPGTLSVHDGGVFRHTGTSAFNIADTAGGTANLIVDGAGSLVESLDVGINLGYHGTAEATVSNGGMIHTTSINLGVKNANSDSDVAYLTISGSGSLVKTNQGFNLGSNSRQAILTFSANSSGFGKLDVGGTFGINSVKASELRFGVDHGVTGLPAAAAATGFEIITAGSISGWKDVNDGIWSATKTGNAVTVKLNPTANSSTSVALDQGAIVIDPALTEAGWVTLGNPDSYYSLTILTTGLNTTEATDLFASWIESGSDNVIAETLEANQILLSTFNAAQSIFAWDFSSYGSTVGLTGVKANTVPEPSTWALLILGVAGLFALRARSRKNR